MSVPPFARALETIPGPQPSGRVRGAASPSMPMVCAVLPAPLAQALITELRRAS